MNSHRTQTEPPTILQLIYHRYDQQFTILSYTYVWTFDHLPALLAAVPTLLNVEVKKFELVAVASVADLAVLVQAVLNIEPK